MSANSYIGILETDQRTTRDDAAALVSRRLTVALTLSATMIAIYFVFMGLFAFDKPLLGTILAPGLSLCILLGPAVIVSSFLLCLIYVVWSNRIYDPAIRQLDK